MRTSAGISYSLLAALLALFGLYGCLPSIGSRPEPHLNFNPVCTASWYGSEFHGRPTASGEIYDMHRLTAAHRHLPLGTRLRVTSLEDGRSVEVIVNDRGPFVHGREIDLSYGAAREIGLIGKGTGRVRLEVLGRDGRYVKYISYGLADKGPYTVQAGSFGDPGNAERLAGALALKYRDVNVVKASVGGRDHYRVRVGRFDKKEDSEALAREMAVEGYTVLVTGYGR